MNNTRLGFVCLMLYLACFACTAVQIFIQPDYENTISVLLTAFSIICLVTYLLVEKPFDDAPLTSLSLLGFCVSAQFAALGAQTAQGQPFVQYLRAPIFTFSTLLTVQLIAIFAHFVYRRFRPFTDLRDWIARTFLSPLGVHDIPKPLMLWLLCPLGLAAVLRGGDDGGGASGKILHALQFLIWMPFLIVVYARQFGAAYATLKSQAPFLLIYSVLLIGIAVAKNTRFLMFAGPVTALLLYLVVCVREKSEMPRRSYVKVLLALGAATFVVVFLADLATAMAVTRDKRDTLTKVQLIEETYFTMLDRAKLDAYRNDFVMQTTTMQYDEVYLSNPILNRLSETKFHDNMLYFAQYFDDGDRDGIIEALGVKFVALLPQPAIDFLDIDIKKEKHFFSMGDIYAESAAGVSPGGYFTGSIWADAWVVFGLFWPFVICLMLWVVFIAIDSFTRLAPGYFISPIALCMAWTLFLYGIGGESFAVKATMLLRDLPQKVLLFALIYWPLRFFWPQLVFKPSEPQGQMESNRKIVTL